MCPTRRLLFQSGLLSTNNTDLPSGDSCGSWTCGSSMMSTNVIGRLAAADCASSNAGAATSDVSTSVSIKGRQTRILNSSGDTHASTVAFRLSAEDAETRSDDIRQPPFCVRFRPYLPALAFLFY